MFDRFPFLPLSIALLLGIFLQHLLRIHPNYLILCFGILLILTLLSIAVRSIRINVHLGLIALICIIGCIRFSVWENTHLEQAYLGHLPIKRINISGTINSLQQGYRLKAIIDLTEISRDSLTADVGGKILIYFPEKFTSDLTPGETITVSKTTLDPLPEPRNPGQFDYAKYLRWRGVVAQCRVDNKDQVVVSENLSGFSFESSVFAPIRSFLIAKIETHFSALSSNFLKALLLGKREGMDGEVIENFQNAGVMHVLAISGLHVGFVALIFYVGLSFFPFYFKYRNLLLILLLLFYMFLTGAQPSVVRATIMAIILLSSINLERPASIYNSIFAAASIILLFQPQQLFWVGFQFSFIAVLSIIYFYEKLSGIRTQLLQHIGNKKVKSIVDKAILIPFFVSFSAQIGTLPLTMHYFHKLSLISFLLNIMVIPFIGLLVVMGFLFFPIAIISYPLAALYSQFLESMIRLLISGVDIAANIPAAFVYIPQFSVMGIILYSIILILLFNLRNKKFRTPAVALSIFFALVMVAQSIATSRSFNIVIMDVGQGDAAFLLTPERKSILIDTGPASQHSSAAQSAILPVLNSFNTGSINRLFISHPHLDHMGGTFDLLRYIHVDSTYVPPTGFSYKWNDSLMHALKKKAIPYRVLRLGDRVIIDKETRAYVLGPGPEFSNTKDPSGQNLNNNSLVLLIRFRDQSLLFPGDAEREAENSLIPWENLLKSDFLKVGHHGSKTSTTDPFFSLVHPRYASISVGEGNHFGHPSENVIRRLRNNGSKVFRTDKDRAIWFQIRNNKWKRVQWY